MTSGKRPAEPAQAAHHLTHNSTHNARHPLASPDNSPRTRKPKSKKKREARYEEELQYNLSYNFRGAGSRGLAQSSRMRGEADFVPPPTYETATAVSTLVAEDFVHQSDFPHPGLVSPAVTVASLPASIGRSHPAVSDASDTFSIDTASLSLLQPPHEGDRSSVELVDLELAERWELDRVRGIPLTERVERHKKRTQTSASVSAGGPPLPGGTHRIRLTSQPTVSSRHPGSQSRFLASQLSLRIPESRDPYDDDQTQDNNSDMSTPPTPKFHRMPGIPGSPARLFHNGRSQSPQPSSSVISLLRNPSPFFKSTPSLLNLSPSHHGTPHRTRTKLFHRKSKERATSEPLEDWEVLERTASGESSVDSSLQTPSPPVTPQRTKGRQLPKSTPPDVFIASSPRPSVDRVRKVNTVQLPSKGPSEVHRPASPPFVARHVRRHTTSSRGSQMSASSAPVSPISTTSTATFDTAVSTISSTEDTIANEDVPLAVQSLAGREVASEPPRAVGTRGHDPALTSRIPRVSSPPPPVPAYEHDPDLPIMSNPALASLPTRSATERIVRPPEVRDENHALVRGRSFSRDMGMRSAPAYSAIFPSGPPTPLLNMTQSLPPPTTTSQQPSPRRHYPGRPLPATPPVSPSLTWILDKGLKQVSPHPKATVSVVPTTPPIPEGLLIDLDDETLDASQTQTLPQPQPTLSPKLVIPPCEDILGLEDEDGNDNDNASDSGTVSPPGPLTPTMSAYGSASYGSCLTLSTAANRSVEFFDTPMQTTPTSDAPYVNGLVTGGLGDQSMAGGPDCDALLLIADLLGPATPPPPPAPPLLQLQSIDTSSPDSETEKRSVNTDVDMDVEPSCLVGEVELVRRRVAKDGRIKLKMSLLGAAVEKCAICMTQFKAGDKGILGATCKHAFHEKCLENWLDQSQTCPLCREPLDGR